jgi:hypothetical protein
MLYYFEIKTGTKSMAGTDANIFVTLVGENGSTTHEERLNGHISGNAFENGDLDKVVLDLEDVGTIKRLLVRSDNKYAGSAWYPEYIRVGKVDSFFTINQWIEDTSSHAFERG